MNVTDSLVDFLTLQNRLSGIGVPPEKAEIILNKSLERLNLELVQVLGQGDNGIAFMASNGDVVKFTIDKGEAILWKRLLDQKLRGIAGIKAVYNLSSSVLGNTPLYLVQVDFVPYPLTPEQEQMIRKGLELVRLRLREEYKAITGDDRNRKMWELRSMRFANMFDEMAQQDPAFSNIFDLLLDLADKHKGFIHDLHPGNFRVNEEGKIILIDPSIPDLLGDIENPYSLAFESRLDLALKTNKLFYE
jgi:hypothetical protein